MMLTYGFCIEMAASIQEWQSDFVLADEAGCFTFKRQQGASNYFLLCTLATDDCSLSNDLLAIRRNLAAANEPDRDKLHATSDPQVVRDRVFKVLAAHEF